MYILSKIISTSAYQHTIIQCKWPHNEQREVGQQDEGSTSSVSDLMAAEGKYYKCSLIKFERTTARNAQKFYCLKCYRRLRVMIINHEIIQCCAADNQFYRATQTLYVGSMLKVGLMTVPFLELLYWHNDMPNAFSVRLNSKSRHLVTFIVWNEISLMNTA